MQTGKHVVPHRVPSKGKRVIFRQARCFHEVETSFVDVDHRNRQSVPARYRSSASKGLRGDMADSPNEHYVDLLVLAGIVLVLSTCLFRFCEGEDFLKNWKVRVVSRLKKVGRRVVVLAVVL